MSVGMNVMHPSKLYYLGVNDSPSQQLEALADLSADRQIGVNKAGTFVTYQGVGLRSMPQTQRAAEFYRSVTGEKGKINAFGHTPELSVGSLRKALHTRIETDQAPQAAAGRANMERGLPRINAFNSPGGPLRRTDPTLFAPQSAVSAPVSILKKSKPVPSGS